MSEIDWPLELRKLEREFDGLPPEPSPARVRARREAERRAQERRAARVRMLGATARLLLVAALAGALGAWPYVRACGPGLFAYLGAEAVVVVGGLWVAWSTWSYRLAKTHAAAMVLVLCGLALITAEVLPRIGYAKVDAKHPPRWWCGDRAPALWGVTLGVGDRRPPAPGIVLSARR
jgi:hypothetical protein